METEYKIEIKLVGLNTNNVLGTTVISLTAMEAAIEQGDAPLQEAVYQMIETNENPV